MFFKSLAISVITAALKISCLACDLYEKIDKKHVINYKIDVTIDPKDLAQFVKINNEFLELPPFRVFQNIKQNAGFGGQYTGSYQDYHIHLYNEHGNLKHITDIKLESHTYPILSDHHTMNVLITFITSEERYCSYKISKQILTPMRLPENFKHSLTQEDLAAVLIKPNVRLLDLLIRKINQDKDKVLYYLKNNPDVMVKWKAQLNRMPEDILCRLDRFLLANIRHNVMSNRNTTASCKPLLHLK